MDKTTEKGLDPDYVASKILQAMARRKEEVRRSGGGRSSSSGS